MSKDVIHFSHANGFPAKSYSKFLEALSDEYEVGYVDILAHNPSYPVDRKWLNPARELVAYLEATYNQPVIGVGHSFGGMVTLLAAELRPDLFKALIILDPPLVLGAARWLMKVAKRFGFIDRITPAARTIGRKEQWDNHQEAYDYFKGKKLFAQFDDDCIWDYVRHGTREQTNHIELIFSPGTEVDIYRTVPDHMGENLKRLDVPTAFMVGKNSEVAALGNFKSFVQNKMKRQVIIVDGGHLFPLEKPHKSAREMKAVLAGLLSQHAKVA